MVFIVEMLQKQVPSWKGGGWRGSGPGVHKIGRLFFWDWGMRIKGRLDSVSKKRLNIKMGKEIRLILTLLSLVI